MPNKEMCKLSIIVPMYNAEQYIKQCMMSLLQSAHKDIEILCIDDGSTDNSGNICEKFALLDKRVKVIHQKNKGLPAVRNVGIASAKGKYLSFVDSDDWVDYRLFEDFIAFMDSNPEVDICIGEVVREYPDGYSIPIFEATSPQLFHRDEALQEMITGRFFFWYMCGKVYRRTVFQGFTADENVTTCEDLDSLWQLFQSGKIRDVWYSPKYKYHYYYNTAGMTEGRKRIERYKSDLYVFEKILKDSDKENAKIMDLIRGRALQSMYSILRENYFINGHLKDVSEYLEKAILILDRMNSDEKKKNTSARRLEQMAHDAEYARAFFKNAFSSMRGAVAEAKNFPEKYIYGTGIVSQYVTVMMEENGDFDGFVISDGRPSTLTFAGKPVYHRSELPREREKVVILAVNGKNQREIMKELNRTQKY